MHGRRVKLMLYNQPRRSLRKEVDIGTLQHAVQRLLVHSIDGCGNAVTSFNEGVEGSSRIMVLDSRMSELWIRPLGSDETWREVLIDLPADASLSPDQISDLAGSCITSQTAKFMVQTLDARIAQLEGVLEHLPTINLQELRCQDDMVVVMLPICVPLGTCLMGDGLVFLGDTVMARSRARSVALGFLPSIDAREGTMMQVLDRHVGKVRVVAYTVASRREVPSVFSWKPINKSLNPIVVAASARLASLQGDMLSQSNFRELVTWGKTPHRGNTRIAGAVLLIIQHLIRPSWTPMAMR